MLFFTSDLHLGHEKAITINNRPFSNVDEMNDTLIDNVNKMVAADDELWSLGDFAYRVSREEVHALRSRIKCRHVHLVYGNHDKEYGQDGIFQSVLHYKELKTAYGRIILFHYPILEWNAAHYGTIHLHGHIHSTGAYNAENRAKFLKDRFLGGHTPSQEELPLRIYDVGVDANQFMSVSLDAIASLLGMEHSQRA